MDTEGQYTQVWSGIGRKYLDDENFGHIIKGQTLTQIFGKYFPDTAQQAEITKVLDESERDMSYNFIPGAEEFLEELKAAGIPAAIVTSSNLKKMENVYRSHPDLPQKVSLILTSESFTRSKPAPDCFLLGMEKLGGTPESTFVFEDSFHGLQAARDSGGIVVGLATTNPRDAVAPLADHVINNFLGMSVKCLTDWLGNIHADIGTSALKFL